MIKHCILLAALAFSFFNGKAQEQQQWETAAEADETQLENDQQAQELQYRERHRLPLNSATEHDWRSLGMITELQLLHFFQYRALTGNLVHVTELQAVPGWTAETVRRLLPYIRIDEPFELTAWRNRFSDGVHKAMVRWSRNIPEKTKEPGNYAGSTDALLFRYRYQSPSGLRFGLTAEKDAGESFKRNTAWPGFDFYGAHFFIRTKKGLVSAIALGDYTVSIGQGLLQWQSFAAGKSADATAIKRQAPVLSPYGSAGEFASMRGAGLTLRRREWDLTLFGSHRGQSAGSEWDSGQNRMVVRSLQYSGLHRTEGELADRKSLMITAGGGVLEWRRASATFSVQARFLHFSKPMVPQTVPDRFIAGMENDLLHYGISYGRSIHNLHLFGELAIDRNARAALVQGCILSADPKVDLAFLYRKTGWDYRSPLAASFAERSTVKNESGWYAGVTVRPSDSWRVDAYADIYRFPWPGYTNDAPGAGLDLLLQAACRPSRKLLLVFRYRDERSPVNGAEYGNSHTNSGSGRSGFRMHLEYKPSIFLQFESRGEISSFYEGNQKPVRGGLFYVESAFPAGGKIQLRLRGQYFSTADYNSRIYAFENDVLYASSVPAFWEEGFRYYFTLRYVAGKKVRFWVKWSQTIRPGPEKTSGPVAGANCKIQSEISF